MEALFSVPKAAKILGVTDRMVRYMVYEQRIPFYKIGARVLFRESDLEAWVQSQKVNVKSPVVKPVDFLNNELSNPEID